MSLPKSLAISTCHCMGRPLESKCAERNACFRSWSCPEGRLGLLAPEFREARPLDSEARFGSGGFPIEMIELYQIPYSPYCIVQRRILEFSGVPFKVVDVPNGDRSVIWRLTRQRYYQVPVLKDRKSVIFETAEDSQVIAKYLDEKLSLGLFPSEWEGVQTILWRCIESEIEGVGFKLNDVYYQETVPPGDHLRFVRHKERKFGRGCLEHWREAQNELLEELKERLTPFEQMLQDRAFLLDVRPRFVDFDLFGILGNFLYTGHYELPDAHGRLQQWHKRMASIKLPSSAREKLHS